MGATFDQSLLFEAGKLMGQESIAKGAHVLLGPCINMQRSPLGGRGFESLSEDPVVAGLGAAAIIRGIESTGVAACIKHFVCNDQEHQRQLYNAIITDRALREIYLKSFQLGIKHGKPSTLMTAYNKINGLHVSESPEILQNILRNEWGFDGLVMSDWFGTYSTTEALGAGLDLEMPGPSRFRKVMLHHSLASNKTSQNTLDDRARTVLKLVDRCARSKIPERAREKAANTPETEAFLRKLASQGIVLLKNDTNILPFKKDKSTLLIGPNVVDATYCGGGSSSLRPYRVVSIWEGVEQKMTSGTILRHAVGTYTHKELPDLGPRLVAADGRPGFDFYAYSEHPQTPNRTPAEHLHLTISHMLLLDFESPRITSPLWYATISGSFQPTVTGMYDFGLCVYGTAKLYIDGDMLIDNTTSQRQGTLFFACGTVEETGSKHLAAGQSYEIRVEFASAPTNTLSGGGVVRFGGGGVRIGCARQIDEMDEISAAVAAARDAEQVIVVAGLGPDWESEGHDRLTMRLPGRTDDLIAAVSQANPNTAVVLQAGMPVEMPWLDQVNGVVQAWYGGNETGNALADVLFGDVSPSGKLPLSFPRRLADNPAYLNFRSESGRVLYGEDVYVGYRYYEAVERAVAFPFAHGLSYSTFQLDDVAVENDGERLTVSVDLKNTGRVAAAEVVQVYVAPNDPRIRRPVKELQGFAKEFLQPGQQKRVTVEMEVKYATGYWDESRGKWKCERDTYRVLVGTSSAGPFVEGAFQVEETRWWNGL